MRARSGYAAQAGRVLRMVPAQGLTLMLTGPGARLAAAAAIARFVASLLNGVSPTDPWAYATSLLVLTAAALMACCIPARRAAKFNPTEAPRNE